MPLPNLTRSRAVTSPPTLDLARITNGMQPDQVAFEISRGARFVVYQYAISALIVSFRRNSGIQFVPAGESPVVKGLPWTLLSFLLGWWGFPWGLIYTPQVLYRNLQGGTDVTAFVLSRIQPTR